MKCEYLTAHCYFQRKNKQYDNDHWALDIFDGEHHDLDEGLEILGQHEWELVAVQQIWTGTAQLNPLPSWYIFKRQLVGK